MEKNMSQKIIEALPYGKGFRFVNKITTINDSTIEGSYHFNANSDFYTHHFIDQPLTPGVLLLESMGQIGLVAHGIYLLDLFGKSFFPAFSHVEADFLKPVPPDTEIKVCSKKIYLRKNMLKSEIFLYISGDSEPAARAIAICNFIKQ
jgi:3-hydroxyacyl-[acyl-carrier-protein] dehydratase